MIFKQRSKEIITNLKGNAFYILEFGFWQLGLFSDIAGIEDENNSKFYCDNHNSNKRNLKNKVEVVLLDGSIVKKHIIHFNLENNFFCITNDDFWDQFD